VDAGGLVYVSDSHAFGEPGPGVFRFRPDGEGELWYGEPVAFANGLALAPGGGSLYVVESFGPGVFRVPILPDGSAGAREEVARLPGTVPDGIAFGPDGLLYVGCYEPSQVLRLGRDGRVELVAADPIAHVLCHPTNVAFRGSTLFAANLGRWHVTAIDVTIEPCTAGLVDRPRDGERELPVARARPKPGPGAWCWPQLATEELT
jgi:sugar lactone lactonase YvrE